MLASALLVAATATGFALLYTRVYPRISLLECIGGAAPLGLTLSAWVALLLKSTAFQRCPAGMRFAPVHVCATRGCVGLLAAPVMNPCMPIPLTF
jgi:hypothetical protein